MKLRHVVFVLLGLAIFLLHWAIIHSISEGTVWHWALLVSANMVVSGAGMAFVVGGLSPVLSRLWRDQLAFSRATVVAFLVVVTIGTGVELILNRRLGNVLLRDLRSPDPSVRVAAARALAVPAYGGAVAELTAVVGNDSDVQVRSAAARALGFSESRSAALPLAMALSDADPGVRAAAAEALERLWDKRRESSFVPAVIDALARERSLAKRASAAIGRDAMLGEGSSSDHRNGRFQLGRLLAKIDDERAVQALLHALREGDVAVVAGGYPFFVARGERGSEATLVAAIDAYGTKEMAETYLNCGNEVLADAAARWATSRGYNIVRSSKGGTARWGGAR